MRGCTRRAAIPTLVFGLALWAYHDMALAQAVDPAIGTWKLNEAKSKFSPGPGPKSVTLTFATAGQSIKVTAEVIDADGKATRTEYTANYDGKDYPITGTPSADSVTLKKIDASTTETVRKKGGRVVATFTRKISSDGKTLTVTQTGTDAKGQSMNNTVVFDRRQ